MKILLLFFAVLILSGCVQQKEAAQPLQFSGIYPHLAYYNNEGECGTGAVVPWADRHSYDGAHGWNTEWPRIGAGEVSEPFRFVADKSGMATAWLVCY